MKLCLRKANSFDDEIGEFSHSFSRRDAFDPLPRRKCSKLRAVPCAFLLTSDQNRLRFVDFLDQGQTLILLKRSYLTTFRDNINARQDERRAYIVAQKDSLFQEDHT